MSAWKKLCPRCGHHNPPQATDCEKDQDDLSSVQAEFIDDIPPSTSTLPDEQKWQAQEVPKSTLHAEGGGLLVLECLDRPEFRFDIRDGQTIGRAPADLDVTSVPKSEYISGPHALFFRRGNRWYVQNLSRTNYTVVDGEKHADDAQIPIGDGSMIVLTYTPFVARIGE